MSLNRRLVGGAAGILFCIFLVESSGAQQVTQDAPTLRMLTLNGNHYVTTNGGKTKNGCEAWLTMLSSGETVYVARCDAARLQDLEMNIGEALRHNEARAPNRRILPKEHPMMIDFVDFGAQALIGRTEGGILAYLVMDSEKGPVYFRAEGNVDQLADSGFDIPGLLSANENAPDEWRVVVGERLNVVERTADGAQMLIGKTASGARVALVLDKHEGFLQVITE